MDSGLGQLIKHVREIPSDIRRLKKSRDMTDETICGTIEEKVLRRIREVKYYDDQWENKFGALAHYTTWKNAVTILTEEKPKFRLYNLETTNDPAEGQAMPKKWTEIAETSTLMKRYGNDCNPVNACNTYGCCFTSGKAVIDSLVWWRLYGDDGKGCCIIVPTSLEMYRVRYRKSGEEQKEDRQVTKELRKLLETAERTIEDIDVDYQDDIGRMLRDMVQHIIEGYSYLFKDVAYSDEQEWRQLSVRPSEETIEYDGEQTIVRRYVEGLSLDRLLVSDSEIIVGPRVANGHVMQAYLKKLVGKAELSATSVRNSTAPYRVVGDQQ